MDAYEVVCAIGRGSFGSVSKVVRKADGRVLVWKELCYGGARAAPPRRAAPRRAAPLPRPVSPLLAAMREREKALVVSEVNILRELRHPFIVRYYDRIIDKASTKLYIVMEFCEGGDLGAMAKKAKREGGAIEEDFVWKVLAQITVALKECHRHRESAPAGGGATPKLKPILHRDLKPGNIFLDGQQNVKVRVCGRGGGHRQALCSAGDSARSPRFINP